MVDEEFRRNGGRGVTLNDQFEMLEGAKPDLLWTALALYSRRFACAPAS